MSEKILGVDIGGVLISKNFPSPHEVPKAFESLKEIKENNFFDRIVVISHCWNICRPALFKWLDSRQFWSRSGVHHSSVHLCSFRSSKRKLCQKFGVTHFLDDRLSILMSLEGIMKERYLFYPTYVPWLPAHIQQIFSWKHFLRVLRAEAKIGSE